MMPDAGGAVSVPRVLEDAISTSTFRDAADLIPHAHGRPDRSGYLDNLGASFATCFDATPTAE